jgi:hypothetical protein
MDHPSAIQSIAGQVYGTSCLTTRGNPIAQPFAAHRVLNRLKDECLYLLSSIACAVVAAKMEVGLWQPTAGLSHVVLGLRRMGTVCMHVPC